MDGDVIDITFWESCNAWSGLVCYWHDRIIVEISGDYIAAQRDAEQSVAAAQRISDSETLARALQSLGRTYETNGVYANALALYQESLNLYESAQNLVGMALSHSASNSLHIQEANAVLSQVRRVVAHDEVDRRLASDRRRNLHQTVRQIVTDAAVG